MKRVLILTDHGLVGHAIRMALRQAAGFEVIGLVDGRRCARAQLAELCPDVVLVDDMDSRVHALARLREVAEETTLADCLLLTTSMSEDWLSEAFDAGAGAIVSKTVHPLAFATLLREVVRGNIVQRPRARPPVPAAGECPLTSRELEILRLASQGMTNAQIACRLWVTQQTVKFHLSNTYRKLGVANRTEASLYAHVNDLVTAA